jgi:hypothetical protein
MFEGVKPFDWLMLGIEAAVLLLILYEVVVGVMRHNEMKCRKKALSVITTSLYHLMDEGLELQRCVPNTATDETEILQSWMTNTTMWGAKASELLADRSPQASATFSLVHDLSSSDSVVFTPSGEVFYLASPLREHYQRLLAQLNSLRQIMGSPEVYF